MVRMALLCQAQMQQSSPDCQAPPAVLHGMHWLFAPTFMGRGAALPPKDGGAPKLGAHHSSLAATTAVVPFLPSPQPSYSVTCGALKDNFKSIPFLAFGKSRRGSDRLVCAFLQPLPRY